MSRRLGLDYCRAFAARYGGSCLSTSYTSSTTAMEWRCPDGHDLRATLTAIRRRVPHGRWCPEDGRRRMGRHRRSMSIARLQQYARSRGGVCTSTEYPEFAGYSRKYTFVCALGHVFRTGPWIVATKTWCRRCGDARGARSRRGSFDRLLEEVRARGGECLSPETEFRNETSPLRLRCDRGHVWLGSWRAIVRREHWCPTCGGSSPLSLDVFRELARARGGVCLSTSYENMLGRLRFRCSRGHEWTAIAGNVRRGSWCSECSHGLGERLCRVVFETLFDCPFPRRRPEWLLSEQGTRLELDGFAEEQGLAFEHQGEQHRRQILFFTRTRELFERRQRLDQRKRELCARRGVVLIEVPEVPKLTAVEDLVDFVRSACAANGVSAPAGEVEIDWSSVYRDSDLARVRSLVEGYGGRLHATAYLGSATPLEVECARGHRSMLRPVKLTVREGTWCAKCRAEDRRALKTSRPTRCA